jgi:hypothetical protein
MLAHPLTTPAPQTAVPEVSSRESFEFAQAVGQQVLRNRLRQAAQAVQAEHGQRVTNRLTLRTGQHYDEHLQGEMALRDKPRDERTQAELEAFTQLLRHQQANTLLAIRSATVDAIEHMVAEPVQVPPPTEREIVITEEPSGLAKFFGARTRITRITR